MHHDAFVHAHMCRLKDCIKNFFTGYLDETDTVILKQKPIVLKYLRGWFWIDFISSIPLDTVLKVVREKDAKETKFSGSETNLRKVMRLLRFAKVVRLLRASRIFRYVRYARRVFEDKAHVIIPGWYVLNYGTTEHCTRGQVCCGRAQGPQDHDFVVLNPTCWALAGLPPILDCKVYGFPEGLLD